MLLLQVHLKFCYEAVLKHATQVLQRHGVTAAASTSKPASSISQKVRQDCPLVGEGGEEFERGGGETDP